MTQQVNNQFQIQGISLTSLAKEYCTPLYVYDGEKIAQQVDKLRSAFKNVDLKIKYASKALTNVAILKLMKKLGVEIDVVSLQEAEFGFKAGYKSNEILFTPNSVGFEEIERAVELGLRINIDNLQILEKFGEKYKGSVPCCIRFNPHIMAGGNLKISTGYGNSKFGISYTRLNEILDIVEKYDVHVNGIHIHTGSDIKDADVFVKGAKVVFEVAKNFKKLEFIDLGSGFKVAYKKEDEVLDVAKMGEKLSVEFQQFCREYGKQLQLWFEPGKFLVSEAGFLLVKANVIKKAETIEIVGVDSGMNHLIRPMMYDAYHEIVNISNPEGKEKHYNVVGYICETDTFGSDRLLNEVRPGDLLILKNAGAYGFSMSSNYNCRLKPAEVLIYNKEARLIRRRETVEDLMRTIVDVEI
ncbi:MAG TPA: diaminopimelate decarboxylase [Cytophagales bacterium]|nr:diaminopimelate decarboxylase [Cytophagales bacterium]